MSVSSAENQEIWPNMRKRYDLPWSPWIPCRHTAIIAKLEAMAPVMFNTQRDEECFSWTSDKIITEFATIAETTMLRIRNFKVGLWWFSFSFTVS